MNYRESPKPAHSQDPQRSFPERRFSPPSNVKNEVLFIRKIGIDGLLYAWNEASFGLGEL